MTGMSTLGCVGTTDGPVERFTAVTQATGRVDQKFHLHGMNLSLGASLAPACVVLSWEGGRDTSRSESGFDLEARLS